jgi:hypothetical protein
MTPAVAQMTVDSIWNVIEYGQAVTLPNDISIRQLQYAVAVADTLGFRRAAKRCHVSQRR